jgi:hypothetical protein
MDLETVSADEFGKSLTGFGINLLSCDAQKLAVHWAGAVGASAHCVSDDFVTVMFGEMMLQIHHVATYGSHALYGFLPENLPRGAGRAALFFWCRP